MLVIGLAATGTWAYLFDSQKSSGNVFSAGTLDLVPLTIGSYSGSSPLYHVTAGGNGVNGKVIFDSIAPGQNGSFEWVLTNSGNLPGTLSVVSGATYDDSVAADLKTLMLANHITGDLGQFLMVTLQVGTGADQTAAEGAMTYVGSSAPVALSNLPAFPNEPMAAFGGSDTVVYKLRWSLSNTDPNVNVVQADKALLNLTFSINQ